MGHKPSSPKLRATPQPAEVGGQPHEPEQSVPKLEATAHESIEAALPGNLAQACAEPHNTPDEEARASRISHSGHEEQSFDEMDWHAIWRQTCEGEVQFLRKEVKLLIRLYDRAVAGNRPYSADPMYEDVPSQVIWTCLAPAQDALERVSAEIKDVKIYERPSSLIEARLHVAEGFRLMGLALAHTTPTAEAPQDNQDNQNPA